MRPLSFSTRSAYEMEIVHEHNLNEPLDVPKPFGIRVTLPATDTFARLIGTAGSVITGTERAKSATAPSPTWRASICTRDKAIVRRGDSSPSSSEREAKRATARRVTGFCGGRANL